nr:SOS response-associated peptidase [Nitrospirota bacterium]
MCGRYSQTKDPEELERRFNMERPRVPLPRRYNIAPSQDAGVIVGEGSQKLELMRWGLVPHWAKDIAISYKMINARAETVAEKPSFKKNLERRRCLVPACGFYEWRKMDGAKNKIPMRFVLKSHEPFAFAGLWDAWKQPDGTELRSFTIITTTANDVLRPVHDRMPVILLQEDTDAQKMTPLLSQYPADAMESFEVSTLVNSPKNDRPECIQAVTAPA